MRSYIIWDHGRGRQIGGRISLTIGEALLPATDVVVDQMLMEVRAAVAAAAAQSQNLALLGSRSGASDLRI
eukprot:SAG11_NODE_16892_length_534_cov_0.908046_1_plen_71_part_00